MPVRLFIFIGRFHAILRPHTLQTDSDFQQVSLLHCGSRKRGITVSEEYVVSLSYTTARRQKLASSPSKSQLLLLRVLKTFLVVSLWGEKGAVKSPTEKYLIGQSKPGSQQDRKATVPPQVWLSCLSGGPHCSLP